MKNWRWTTVVLLLGGAAVAGLWLAGRPGHGPVHNGKPLSYWTTHLYGVEFDQAFEAIRAIGPAGVPWQLRQIRSNHALWRRLYLKVWLDLPQSLKPHLAQPLSPTQLDERVLQALSVLKASGVPPLVAALQDGCSSVRRVAALALGRMSLSDGVVTQAAPGLCQLLFDPDRSVRNAAMETLSKMRADAPSVVLVLTSMVNGTSSRDRSAEKAEGARLAVQLLGQMGSLAKSAAPELKHLIAQASGSTRMEAALALWQITHETNCMAVLLQEMKSPADSLQVMRAFQEMGSDSSALSVPKLTTAFASSNAEVRLGVLHTLQSMRMPVSSLPIYARALSDPDPRVSTLAAQALLLRGSWREAKILDTVLHPWTNSPAKFVSTVNEDEADLGLLQDLGLRLSRDKGRKTVYASIPGSPVSAGALNRLLADRSNCVRVGAAVALWRVYHATNGLSVLTDQLNLDPDDEVWQQVFATLEEMGPAARQAGPVVQSSLARARVNLPKPIWRAGWNALCRIDPEASRLWHLQPQ